MPNDTHHHETDDPLAEMRDLLAAFEANELTDRQDLRLQQLVAENEPARHLYLRYMFMYGKMHQKHHAGRNVVPPTNQNHAPSSNSSIFPLLDIEKELLSSSDTVDEFGASKAPDPNNASSGGIFGNFNSRFLPGLITIISSILILSVVVVLPVYWSTGPELKWDIVARVSNMVDCQWKQDGIKPAIGSFLTSGQKLELELGLAEVEFISGAKVILEGPAEFTIAGNNASNLALGRLAATVPEGAEGFIVETPDMEVTDLGTEFGVLVGDDGNVDVHVFKGVVEAEVTNLMPQPENHIKRSPKQRKLRLEKDQAIQYDKTVDDVASIPIDKKRFVRSLDRSGGVTANLRVTNPSFELPDIQTVPEFRKAIGNTLFRPIYGWKVSGHDRVKSKVAMYQISPYASSIANGDVGPGATDGEQVATISLGVEPSSPGQPRSNWIYQSLGMVTSADLGKTLKLSVDAGPRSAHGRLGHGDGTVFAGFALHVTPRDCGMVVGTSDSFRQGADKVESLHRLQGNLTIVPELVGQKLFILLAVRDDGSNRNTYQYHFDNVKVVKD